MTSELVGPILRRRALLAGSLALVLAAACSRSGDSEDETELRSVESSRGDVRVPVAPKRVAALVGSTDIDVLALGVPVVFAGEFARNWTSLPKGIKTSDLVPPNPESVAAAQPDLLLGWDWLVDDPAWAGLSEIAPAVTIPEDVGWRDAFLVVADAVNKRDQGIAALAEFDADVAQLRTELAALGPREIALVASWDPAEFYWWDAKYPTCEILQSLGFQIYTTGQTPDQRSYSAEHLGQLQAPWIIYTAPPESEGTDALLASQTWHDLPAVKSDQVIMADRNLWGGAGLIWARALLEDIRRLFLAG